MALAKGLCTCMGGGGGGGEGEEGLNPRDLTVIWATK